MPQSKFSDFSRREFLTASAGAVLVVSSTGSCRKPMRHNHLNRKEQSGAKNDQTRYSRTTAQSRRIRGWTSPRVCKATHSGAIHFLRPPRAGRFSGRTPTIRRRSPHPHIGLSTVTYLFEGEIIHRDCVGSEQAIRPGEVNWMTAGRGITHSVRFERARREGGRTNGIQAWVALPTEEEETDPAFYHYDGDPFASLQDAAVRMWLIDDDIFARESLEASPHY